MSEARRPGSPEERKVEVLESSSRHDGDVRLAALWSNRIPTVLGPWAPQVADVFVDGAWIAVSAPRVTAYAPIAAAAVGFFAPFLWPGMATVYSESLLFMALVVGGAILSGPVGVMLFVGYVVGDLLAGARHASLGRVGGQVVSYLLLAIPAIRIPVIARRFIQTDHLPDGPTARVSVIAILYAFACGLLVFLWCQAMIVLIRPVFTWTGRSPDVSAIITVQRQWVWLAALAVVAALARIVLEEWTKGRSSPDSAAGHAEDLRPTDAGESTSQESRVPAIVRVALWTTAITLMLAGTYGSVLDAVAVAGIAGTLVASRTWPGNGVFRNLSVAINEVPGQVRLVIASAIGFLCSYLLLQGFWTSGSLRPLMVGALITMVLFRLLFPRPGERPSSGGAA